MSACHMPGGNKARCKRNAHMGCACMHVSCIKSSHITRSYNNTCMACRPLKHVQRGRGAPLPECPSCYSHVHTHAHAIPLAPQCRQTPTPLLPHQARSPTAALYTAPPSSPPPTPTNRASCPGGTPLRSTRSHSTICLYARNDMANRRGPDNDRAGGVGEEAGSDGEPTGPLTAGDCACAVGSCARTRVCMRPQEVVGAVEGELVVA